MSEKPKLDLLKGADEIAEFMFGSKSERRQIYHLADHHGLPIIRLGKKLYARESSLVEWVQSREAKPPRPR